MKIGVSSHAFQNYSPEATIKRISEMEFEAWELVLEGRHAKKDYSGIKELVESYDLVMFVHAPFSDLNIASLNQRIRRESLSQIFESVEVARYLEASLISVHPGRLSPMAMYFKEEAWEANINSFKEIADFASDCGIKACLENPPSYFGAFCCSIGEIKEVLTMENKLKLALDLGHANTCGDVKDYIRELRPWIRHLHLHDNDGIEDTHSEIGKGNLDLKVLLPYLKDCKDFIIIEVKEEEAALKSKEKLEELISS